MTAWRQVVANDMIAIKQAIKAKDIDQIGHIAEENALRMHALTLSADPGFTYFNGETLTIIKAVEDLRNQGVNCYYYDGCWSERQSDLRPREPE